MHWLRQARRVDGNGRVGLRQLTIAALWNGIVVNGGTTWAMAYAQGAFRASTAALSYAMEPLFAAVYAAFILNEGIVWPQLVGGALIVTSNVLASIRATE